MRWYSLDRLAMLGSLALCSCGGGGGSGGGPPTVAPPPDAVANYTFPSGDATAPSGSTAWDIVGVKTTLSGQFGSAGGNSYDTLRVDVTFTQDVTNALPAPGQPLATGTQLGVQIGLDTDANSNTGAFDTCSSTVPVRALEYRSDQGNFPTRLSDGNYAIIGAGGAIGVGGGAPTEAVASVSGHMLSESFFLPSIGVLAQSAVPQIGLIVAAYNGKSDGPTDCVPYTVSEMFTHK